MSKFYFDGSFLIPLSVALFFVIILTNLHDEKSYALEAIHLPLKFKLSKCYNSFALINNCYLTFKFAITNTISCSWIFKTQHEIWFQPKKINHANSSFNVELVGVLHFVFIQLINKRNSNIPNEFKTGNIINFFLSIEC